MPGAELELELEPGPKLCLEKIVAISEKILKNTGTGAQIVPGIFSMKIVSLSDEQKLLQDAR